MNFSVRRLGNLFVFRIDLTVRVFICLYYISAMARVVWQQTVDTLHARAAGENFV